MKAIKLYIPSLILTCLVMIASCSDNIISPGIDESAMLNQTDSQMNLEENSYNAKISLSPGETIVFHYGNTNLILIHSYTISNCYIVTEDLFISSSMHADSTSLPCRWKKSGNFAFEDLSVKNISNEKKLISVRLRGYTLNK